ncbi:hypothetical protein HK101_003246 [Irineochytrium annulatum]|nr:hypothetical protein HK101_003246 [Irineochytrium annulatum]
MQAQVTAINPVRTLRSVPTGTLGAQMEDVPFPTNINFVAKTVQQGIGASPKVFGVGWALFLTIFLATTLGVVCLCFSQSDDAG